jgi:hypothetical protein
VRGEPGIGKTLSLETASRRASGAPGRWCCASAVCSRRPNCRLRAYTCWCTRSCPGVDRLPGPQRAAASADFGINDAPAPGPFLIALATLSLLADVAEQAPLLLVVEHAQRLDRPTAEVLAFFARRVESEPIAVPSRFAMATRAWWFRRRPARSERTRRVGAGASCRSSAPCGAAAARARAPTRSRSAAASRDQLGDGRQRPPLLVQWTWMRRAPRWTQGSPHRTDGIWSLTAGCAPSSTCRSRETRVG